MRALCWHLLMGLVQQKLKKLEKVLLAAVGIEPPNSWLQAQCSTNEPPRLTCWDVLIAHIYLTWRIEMLRLLLIFPQQLSKTCPLAKKILSLRQKYEKKEMILVIFLLRSEIAFFLDSWKSNFFFRAFFEHSREIFNNSQARYKKFHSNVQKKLSKKIWLPFVQEKSNFTAEKKNASYHFLFFLFLLKENTIFLRGNSSIIYEWLNFLGAGC